MKVALKRNDNLLEVDRVRRKVGGVIEYDTVGDATVTATLMDPDENELSGQAWPLTLQFVATSQGKFEGTLDNTIDYGELIQGKIKVEISWDGVTAEEICDIFFEEPTCCEIITAPEEDVEETPTEIDIIAAANQPREVRGDEGSIVERDIDELIKADRYKRSQDAVGQPPFGMHVCRIRSGSTIESPSP